MELSLKLLETNSDIYQKILSSLLPDVERYMSQAINTIKKELPNLILLSIISSNEYASIIGGKLKYELGINDGISKIDGLLQIWTNNMSIKYEPPRVNRTSINSKFSISMIKADYSDVLGTDYAYVEDSIRNYKLPWLQWLLLDGTKILVDNHQVIIGLNPASRTSMAIMGSGPGWSIPNEFAGTASDNWITRAIDSSSDSINNLLRKAFKV